MSHHHPDIPSIILLQHSIVSRHHSNQKYAPLSQEGINLARVRRARLGNPSFDLAFFPPLRCMLETAQVIAGKDPNVKMEPISSLFFEHFPSGNEEKEDPRKVIIKTAFEKLGIAAPCRYFEDDKTREALLSLAKEACEIILGRFRDTGAKKALIIAPGMLIPILCRQFRNGTSDFDRQVVEKECTGFGFNLGEDGQIISWSKIP